MQMNPNQGSQDIQNHQMLDLSQNPVHPLVLLNLLITSISSLFFLFII
jgi:hypothetical protein